MAFRRFGLFMAGILTLGGHSACAEDMTGSYIQIAQLTIDPAYLSEYSAAVSEQIAAAVRDEPGVLSLQAVADKSDPTKITVFEVYASEQAYQEHLESPHFKTYKTTVELMVKSLKLVTVSPIQLRSKSDNIRGTP